MAVPIRSFGSTPGGCATNCASTTRADPIPSSSRCRRAATCPSSKRIPPHPPTRLLRLVLPAACTADTVRSRTSGARGSPSALWRSSRRWSPPRSPGAHSARRRSAPAQLLPLASYPGVEGPPALSPDGNLVAFAWSGHAEAGPTDIYVKAVGSEALRRLTETPEWETSPAWSPDGHSIAFVRDGQGVFTMSQLGGAERQVSASGTHVAWAGDSKSVLIRDREGNTGPFGIYQVFLDTLERRRLTQAPVGAGDWRFEVSPDGNTLAFIRYEKPGESRTCTSCPCEAANRGGSRTGTHTLTGYRGRPMVERLSTRSRSRQPSRLWRIHANSATPGRGSPIADIPAAAANPSISRPMPGQPARLAFQTITRDVDLHLMDLEARLVNDTIESKPFSNSTRIEGSARFSPDGSRIAFMSSPLRSAWRCGSLDAMEADFSRSRHSALLSFWSVDGPRTAQGSRSMRQSPATADVYVVGADGGHLRRLTSEPSMDGVPSWSGDGRWIYFASTRAGVIPDIWRVSPDGGPATRMTRNGGFEPKESPDGRYLFYLDRHPAGLAIDGTARLMRLPLAGGQEELVLERVRPFLWSVTDTGIVFVTREPDFDAIDVYRFSDQRVARVGRLGFRIPGIFTHMTVSRDGRWALATEMVRFDSDLMRLDNFR